MIELCSICGLPDDSIVHRDTLEGPIGDRCAVCGVTHHVFLAPGPPRSIIDRLGLSWVRR